MKDGRILSVAELNNYIKMLVASNEILADIYISGEVSNFKLHSSGHMYFTLKDEESVLRAVMFRGEAGKLKFAPENGMKVIAHGRVSVFPRDGQYQLYCDGLTPDGVGALYIAFEQLKAKLETEGLFELARKRPLPAFPEKIGIVTSPTGAAIRDMLRILGKRYPLAKVLLCPVRVQGEEASPEICEAIRILNEKNAVGLIIVGRGGGSIEDLWPFNDEFVARAISASKIPVISAVGHEPDFTISDFVADLRAATPSNAAELAVPDTAELRARLLNGEARMIQALHKKLSFSRTRLESAAAKKVMTSPAVYLAEKRMLLDFTNRKLGAAGERIFAAKRRVFAERAATLDAISPLKVLGRGYSITRAKSGGAIKSAGDVNIGERIDITLGRGSLECEVTGKTED